MTTTVTSPKTSFALSTTITPPPTTPVADVMSDEF
jgi:hypothetical protein